MNAFSLYLILQLDSIGTTLAIVSIVGALASVIGLAAAACTRGDESCRSEVDHTVSNEIFKYAKRGLITCVALFAFNGLLPSSKTAAVMIVLPAVANNENIQREAGELYQIAKQGLADLVKKAVTPKEEPAKESPK
jgi:mannose/fructose/N-acetylgalactosamine-specific phosphotransferase system component IIC